MTEMILSLKEVTEINGAKNIIDFFQNKIGGLKCL